MAHHSLLIRGAQVLDGSGAPASTADVAVDGGCIARVGSLDADTADSDIDASGLSLAPGFIDVHTHDDFAAIAHRDMGFKSPGGVTTCIVGNCGFGAAPYPAAMAMLGTLTPGLNVPAYEGHAGYAAALQMHPPGVNIGVLAGHGTLRKAVMGDVDRPPDGPEMAAMGALLEEALEAGVLGMSSGLIYEPGRHAATQELADLSALMRERGGLYVTHMRDEGAGLLASVEEAIRIGAEAGVGVQISHHKASGKESWGLVERSLALIEAAQARGQDVHADQYPYTAGSTMLAAVLANGAFLGEPTAGGIGTVDPRDVVIASAPGHPQWEGHSVAALVEMLGLPPRQAAELVADAAHGATAVLHMMREEDVQRILRHPSTIVGSDGIPNLDGRPHPRLYNTFARVLGHYARDLGLFDLATAIYRMTGFAARKFGLADRGCIREGAFADLVLFDAETIIDRGTFEHPNRYPLGIEHVFVNGQHAVDRGALTAARAGKVLRRAG
jgi:N-acyl-D-amino-acid deacylase